MSEPAPGPVAGNVYNKYETSNPVARRLMRGFDEAMFRLLDAIDPPGRILEVGCGEGFVARKLAERFPGADILATDLSPEVVAFARDRHPEIEFRACSVYELDRLGGGFDLVVAAEVLEHLEDPGRGLRAIGEASAGSVFVSVPREPVWRVLNLLRGKYLRDLGNTPGHVQHWSTGAFLDFLGGEMEVAAHETPLPWTQALCRPRR